MPASHRTADPVEALLEQLEALSGDAIAGDNIAPHPIDHRMRMLFSRCAHRLRVEQAEMERVTTEAAIMKERADALRVRAVSLVSRADKRLKIARTARRSSESYAAELVAKAEASSVDVLESAMELADSFVGHQEIGVDAIGTWMSETAGEEVDAMIRDFESRIVEVGTVRDELGPRSNTAAFDAA